MSPTAAPNQIAACGREPYYYEQTQFGRSVSSDWLSWKGCMNNHPAQLSLTEEHFPEPNPPAPYVPPAVDQAQVWVAQHSDLLMTLGAVVVLALIAVVLIVLNNRSKKASHR